LGYKYLDFLKILKFAIGAVTDNKSHGFGKGTNDQSNGMDKFFNPFPRDDTAKDPEQLLLFLDTKFITQMVTGKGVVKILKVDGVIDYKDLFFRNPQSQIDFF
jgi:hypothetical protein